MFEALLKRFGYEKTRNFRRSGPGFGAAQVTRLTADFTTSELSADSELRQDHKRLRARVRKLKNDYGYARKYVSMWRTNVLGENGINFRCKAKDPDKVVGGTLTPGKLDVFANKAIEDAWWTWGKKQNCTVTRQLTWKDAQDVIVEAIATDGECLIRKVRGFDNPFRFAVQLIESDHLDVELNKPLREGSEIRMGVEFNSWKEPVAYHLLKSHPNDNFYPSQAGQRYQRIPASEIIHPFLRRRIGQSRGYPPMATALTQMNMLAKYQEAELVAAREEACKGGWFKKTGETGYAGTPDAEGNLVDEVEPGVWKELPYGLEPVQNDPKHPNGNFGDFTKITLREIAAGLEHLSYNTFGLDMESVNFASGKLGIEEERLGWKILQMFVACHVCEPIFEPWLESTMLAGVITLPFSKFDKFNAPCWTGRRWQPIDSTKEVGAMIQKLNAGLTSRSRCLAEEDVDRDELDQEIAEDKASQERHGLQFTETDPEPDPIELEEAKAKLRPAPAKAA